MSLTRRTLFIALFITLLAIAGQWSAADIQSLWRYPAALLLFGLLLEGLRARTTPPAIRRTLDEQLALGEPHPLHVGIHNHSSRPLTIRTQARYPETLHGDEALDSWVIPAGELSRRTTLVTPLSPGHTRIGTLYTRILGHMGLAWWSRKVESTTQSRVVPRALSHNEQAAGQLLSGERYTPQQFCSGDNLLALRDYRAGDPIKSIDWKATARRGQPIVRVFAREQSLDLMLVIDAGRSSRLQAGHLTRLDHYLNIAARLAQLACSHGDQVGLLGFSSEHLVRVPPGHGARALQQVRTGLTTLKSQQDDFNPIAAALEIQKLLWQRSLVVFLCEMEQREAAEQLTKACTLLAPKHLAIVASLVDTDIQNLQERECTDWLDPYRRYAAQEFTRSQQSTALHLQRLGTQVVLGTEDELDQRVMRRYQYLRNRRRV